MPMEISQVRPWIRLENAPVFTVGGGRGTPTLNHSGEKTHNRSLLKMMILGPQNEKILGPVSAGEAAKYLGISPYTLRTTIRTRRKKSGNIFQYHGYTFMVEGGRE